MTRWRIAALSAGLVGIVGVVYASNGGNLLRASLSGYQEVPTLSSSGSARFVASISKDETEVRWKLSYANLESDVTQSHIHFSAPGMSGPVVVFLCTQSRERSDRNPDVPCRARDNQRHVYGRRRSRWCGWTGARGGESRGTDRRASCRGHLRERAFNHSSGWRSPRADRG